MLATCTRILHAGMQQDEIEQAIADFVAEMEREIAGAYSVRLLGNVPTLNRSALRPM